MLDPRMIVTRSDVARGVWLFGTLEGRLQEIHESLAELGNLRADDDRAVRLVRVVAVILLMVVLRRVELVERRDLGDDSALPDPLLLDLADHLFGLLLLLG